MRNVLVTGADGFIGKNLCARLRLEDTLKLSTITRSDDPVSSMEKLRLADIIFHLAGVNRPENDSDFVTGNVGFLRLLLDQLRALGTSPAVVFSSTTQAAEDNAYGRSKEEAERLLREYAVRTGAGVIVYRLPNVFGKWSRPNYNSVVATFCHNAARGLTLEIHDPARRLRLAYIDDVVASFLAHALAPANAPGYQEEHVEPTYDLSLVDLAATIQGFARLRGTLGLPEVADPLVQKLYATYLSYVPADDLSYVPPGRSDDRGTLVELLKGTHFGQIFVSTTRPGVTRGNHFHHTKVEKFFVVAGNATICLRDLSTGGTTEIEASGAPVTVVDIPPGSVHNIKNTGATDLIVLFWASEPFDQESPDTYFEEV